MDLSKGDHGTCETVTIKTDAGNVVINKADYNEDEHDLAEGKAAVSSKWSKMTVEALKKALKKGSIDIPEDAKKDDLVELAEKHLA